MALTFTIAGLQAELDTYNTAVQAESWTAAWLALGAYSATYAGLAESVSADGGSITLPKPAVLVASLEKMIDGVKVAAAKATAGRKRFLRIGVRHHG